MEKILTNINVSQICSITSYLKRRNPWYIYKKSKRFLFFWNRKEGYYNFGWLDPDVYTTIDEIEKKNKHLYCENERGEKFIVELQKAKQNFFKDRSVYYSTFPIQEQAKQGNWNFELKAVYTIGILDFMFDDHKHELNKILHKIKLSDIIQSHFFNYVFTGINTCAVN